MRLVALLALLPAIALADVTVNGTVSLVNDADAGVAAPVEVRDFYGSSLAFADDGRVDIARDSIVWSDRFVGSAVAAHNKWNQSILTQTATVATGGITLNASAITTINTYSNLQTLAKFRGFMDGDLYVHARARPVNLPQTNAVAELGLGNALTNAAPTDGAFFRWTSSGGFECVLNRGGAETSSSMTAPTANVFTIFAIKVSAENLECTWSTPSSGANARVVVTLDSGAPSAFNEAPGGLMRVVNGASAPALAPQLVVGIFEVSVKTHDVVRSPDLQNTVSGQSVAFTPTTGAQSANHTNSTSPTSATLSNTAAGYTTLGGRWQFAAPAGAVTDFALFGYQVPTSYRLIVTGIAISSCNNGAAVATTPTELDWSVGVQSTAVSLATADAIAASPTSAPRRVALGHQGFVVGAAVGSCVPDIVRDFSKAPLVVDSARFLHIIVQVPVGTATASQVIRGDVTVMGYFEMQ